LALTALVSAPAALASQVVLNAINTGLYTSDGEFQSPNHITGTTRFFDGESRGYLVFDLSTLSFGDQVTAATLRMPNEDSLNEVGPNDPLGLRVYGLPGISPFSFGNGYGDVQFKQSTFNYIGSPSTPKFAEDFVLSTDVNTTLEFGINAAGVADINASRGDDFYGYGLKVNKADVEFPKPLQFVFENSDNPNAPVELVLEITEVVGSPGDFDIDGDVDGRDFLVWQRGGSPSPFSNGDLGNWQANYGTMPLVAAITAVPEPGTWWFALSVLLGQACRRSRQTETKGPGPCFWSNGSAPDL
jgi:hypothetical protein